MLFLYCSYSSLKKSILTLTMGEREQEMNKRQTCLSVPRLLAKSVA